ncbi:MAG: dethiobiotin synthase [Aeromicrobium sp.]|nr:dethiobiotin synthase [Burkholderiales bacterium]
MLRNFFITGTDTDVGKTFVTCALIEAFATRGFRAMPMKPIAAGTMNMNGVVINADVAALREVSGTRASLADINPYCFVEPIAPHLAAQHEKVFVDLNVVHTAFERIKSQGDCVLVEGAGGFLVPLSMRQSMADIPSVLSLDIILVVGMRLGVLNHALLTVEAIRSRGLILGGWIANTPTDSQMLAFDENQATLEKMIDAPLLGCIPYDAHSTNATEGARRASSCLRIETLLC